MRKLLPLILALLGLLAGVGAGAVLKKPAEDLADTCAPADAAPPATKIGTAPVKLERDYVRMNNQFVIPVVADGRIKALVVMSLSLEVARGAREQVYAREPKLRDAFLRVMFDHANSGGFDGDFTSNGNMAHLREALGDAGRSVLGELVSEVLIIDIVRQDS